MPTRASSSESQRKQQVAFPPAPSAEEPSAAQQPAGQPSSRGVKFPDNLPLPLPRKASTKNVNTAHTRSMSVPDLEDPAEQQPRRFGIVRKLSLKRFADRAPSTSGPAPPPGSTSNGHAGNVAASMIPRSLSRKGSLSRLGSSRGAQASKRSAAAMEVPQTSSTQPLPAPLTQPMASAEVSSARPSRQPTRSASHMANLGKGIGVPSPVMESPEMLETPRTPPAQSLSPESAARRARATRDSSLSPRKSSFRGVRAASSPYSRQAHRPSAPSSNVSSSSKSSISPAQRAAREWRAKLVNLSSASPEHTDEEAAATGFGGPRPPPRPKTAAAGQSNPSTPLSEVPPSRPRHRRRSLDSLVSVSTKSGRHPNVSPACSAFGDAFDEQRLSIWSADFDALSLHGASVSSSTVSRVSRGTNKSMKSNKSKASTNLTMVPEVPKIPDHMLSQLSSQLSSISGAVPLVPTSAVGQGAKGDTASMLSKSTRGHNRSATEGQSTVVTAVTAVTSMTAASAATTSTELVSTPEWQPSERFVAVRSSAPNMSPVPDEEEAEPKMPQEEEPKALRGLGLKMDLTSLKAKPLPPPPAARQATTPPPSLSPEYGPQPNESPYHSLSTRRTSTPDHTEYLVTPTCATVDEKLLSRAGPVVVSDSEGESAPERKQQRPMGPRKYNGHIRDASDVRMAIALAQQAQQSHKLTRSQSSDSKSKVHVGGPREPNRPSPSVSRSTSQTLVNAAIPRTASKSASLDQGPELLMAYDLTPGLEDGGRRPRKKGMPMQDLRKWLETSG